MSEFAPRFVDGHARANRPKPSGIGDAAEQQERGVPHVGSNPAHRDEHHHRDEHLQCEDAPGRRGGERM